MMFRSTSVIGRIIVLHVVVILLASILFPAVLIGMLSRAADKIQFDSLIFQAREVAEAVSLDQEGRLALAQTAELQSHFSRSYGRYSFEIFDKTGAQLASAGLMHPSLENLPFDKVQAARPFEVRADKHDLTGAVLPIVVSGQQFWIRVNEDLSHPDALQDDVVRDFIPRISAISVVLFVIVGMLDVLIVKRAFHPLDLASRLARSIIPGHVQNPIPVALAPDEVKPFIGAVNVAIERLQHAYRAQKEFASDAAHELRTPLSVIRMRADTFPVSAERSALIRDVEQMTRTVNEFIEFAEVESLHDVVLDKVDLRAAAIAVVEQLALLAIRAGRSLEIDDTAACDLVSGNRNLVQCAIRNLAENAIRATAAGGMVKIVVSGASIKVLDDGPGIPVPLREEMFLRFHRADARSGRSGGLGLAIVKNIMDLHMGEIHIEDRLEGGSAFELRFQPSSPS